MKSPRSRTGRTLSPALSLSTRRGSGGLRLSISAQLGRAVVPYLRRNLSRAHAILKPTLCEMSLALVNDKRMSELHEQFMNIAGPTDVLTFPLELDARGRAVTGDVAVCVPEARRRARENGNEVRNELLLYALHGMLHLCGFDDRTARGYERMHRTEDQILSRLGIGPVFQAKMTFSSRRTPQAARRRRDRKSTRLNSSH